MAKNEAVEQARNFFKGLNATQMVLIGSALALVLGGIIYILASSGSADSGKAILYTKLDQAEASKVVDYLKENNIEYELRDNGETIAIDKAQLYETRLSLAKEGIPQTGMVGYEIFDKTNLGMSEFVQKVNYRRALEGEIARTIGAMDEVEKVRVHLVVPENALFEKDQKQPTASVILRLKSGRSISKINVEGMQNLVASSVEGMQTSHVTVIDQKGKILSQSPIDDKSISGMSSKQHQTKIQVDDYLTNKVQSMLDGVLGAGNSEVRINADLNFDQITSSSTKFDPESQVVRSEQEIENIDKSTENYLVSESEQYGLDFSDTTIEKPATNSEIGQKNIVRNYEINKTVEEIVKEVGNVKRLSVSVLINHRLEPVKGTEGNKQMQFMPRKQQEMVYLTNIIKDAVGYDQLRADSISVYNMLFDTQLLEKQYEEMNVVPWYQQPENVKLLIFLAAMILIIFLIFRLLNTKQVKERFRIAFQLPEHVAVDEEIMDEDEEAEEARIDLDFTDDEELMLLPAELPEQLLLESDRFNRGDYDEDSDEDEKEGVFDKQSLADRARAALEEGEPVELTEDAMMKLEIKEKVQEFVDDQTPDAVKLIRMFIMQDIEKGIL